MVRRIQQPSGASGLVSTSMIETDSQASHSSFAPRRLTARAVRVRNGCLAALARARSMPAPSSADLESLPNTVGLAGAWQWWSGKHAPTPRVVVTDVREVRAPASVWWRSRRVGWGILAASVLASAWGLRAQVRPFLGRAAAVEPWTPVADSSLAHINGVLLDLGRVFAPVSLSLTPADVAALVFSSSLRRRPAAVSNLEARVDSLISIRGTLADASGNPTQFEVRGAVRVARPGLGQFDVAEFYLIDGPIGRRAVEVPPIRFILPRFVRDLKVMDGVVILSRGQSR
jgi:hypothetical protein